MSKLFAADADTGEIVETVTITKSDLKDLQQRPALKDLEIMRLREALENWSLIISYQYTGSKEAMDFLQNADNLGQQTLSTSTTYDDLMAWHEAQLGEPKVWWTGMDDTNDDFMSNELKQQHDKIKSSTPKYYPIPLYAKKG